MFKTLVSDAVAFMLTSAAASAATFEFEVNTSVGITARVLSDLGKTQARESKIILGAAVIDDILGLVF